MVRAHDKSAFVAGFALVAGFAGPVLAQRGYETPPPSYYAPQNIQLEDFYSQLAPYGHWFVSRRYGRVWQPFDIGPGWRPYTLGHWLFTQEYGWYWASDEDWGWAAYHYGRWTWDEDNGWIWVPDTRWGPAWVAWRHGGGYYGWAPLPPEVVWQEKGRGFDFRGIDLEADYYRPAWVFVPEQYVVLPHLGHYCLSPEYNVTIVHHSRNITNYVTEHNVVVNHSMDVHEIERVTHRSVRVQDRGVFDRPAGRLGDGPTVTPDRRSQPVFATPAPDYSTEGRVDRPHDGQHPARESAGAIGRRPYEQNVGDVRRLQQVARAQFEERQRAELAHANEHQRPQITQQQQIQRVEMEHIQNRELHVAQRVQQQSAPVQPAPAQKPRPEPHEQNRDHNARERL